MLHICTMRIGVSLDREQIKLLRTIKGFGKKDAEVLKNIFFAYLTEKGYLDKLNKK